MGGNGGSCSAFDDGDDKSWIIIVVRLMMVMINHG